MLPLKHILPISKVFIWRNMPFLPKDGMREIVKLFIDQLIQPVIGDHNKPSYIDRYKKCYSLNMSNLYVHGKFIDSSNGVIIHRKYITYPTKDLIYTWATQIYNNFVGYDMLQVKVKHIYPRGFRIVIPMIYLTSEYADKIDRRELDLSSFRRYIISGLELQVSEQAEIDITRLKDSNALPNYILNSIPDVRQSARHD